MLSQAVLQAIDEHIDLFVQVFNGSKRRKSPAPQHFRDRQRVKFQDGGRNAAQKASTNLVIGIRTCLFVWQIPYHLFGYGLELWLHGIAYITEAQSCQNAPRASLDFR